MLCEYTTVTRGHRWSCTSLATVNNLCEYHGEQELVRLRSSLTAERDKLKAMLLFSLEEGARNVRNRSLVFSDLVPVEHAGTPESILESVARAMESKP